MADEEDIPLTLDDLAPMTGLESGDKNSSFPQPQPHPQAQPTSENSGSDSKLLELAPGAPQYSVHVTTGDPTDTSTQYQGPTELNFTEAKTLDPDIQIYFAGDQSAPDKYKTTSSLDNAISQSQTSASEATSFSTVSPTANQSSTSSNISFSQSESVFVSVTQSESVSTSTSQSVTRASVATAADVDLYIGSDAVDLVFDASSPPLGTDAAADLLLGGLHGSADDTEPADDQQREDEMIELSLSDLEQPSLSIDETSPPGAMAPVSLGADMKTSSQPPNVSEDSRYTAPRSDTSDEPPTASTVLPDVPAPDDQTTVSPQPIKPPEEDDDFDAAFDDQLATLPEAGSTEWSRPLAAPQKTPVVISSGVVKKTPFAVPSVVSEKKLPDVSRDPPAAVVAAPQLPAVTVSQGEPRNEEGVTASAKPGIQQVDPRAVLRAPYEVRSDASQETQDSESDDEWEDRTVTAGPHVGGRAAGALSSPQMSYEEAIVYFRSADLSEYRSRIQPVVRRSGFAAIKHAIIGPPKLKARHVAERDNIFLIAQCPFDNRSSEHVRMLQTIYKRLTGMTLDCPRYGGHWETIGFQGTDPSTDLRGMGMLGVVCLLYMTSPPRLRLAQEILQLSRHHAQNFPYSVMSINMTRMALQIFREEHLNKECNHRAAVTDVFMELYAGLYLQLFAAWRTRGLTIADSGYVIRELEQSGRKHTKDLLRQFQSRIESKAATQLPSASTGADTSQAVEIDQLVFKDMGELD